MKQQNSWIEVIPVWQEATCMHTTFNLWFSFSWSCEEQGVGCGDPYEFYDSVWGEEGFRAKEMFFMTIKEMDV